MNTEDLWNSKVTNEMAQQLSENERVRLSQELDDAVMEICLQYGVGGN
jgi:signal transduction histidine kinase